MIQKLIIPLEDRHAFLFSSSFFLPAHITAAHKLLFHEIKNEIKFSSDGKAVKVGRAPPLEPNRNGFEYWMALDGLCNLLES